MGERFTHKHLDFFEQIQTELISPAHKNDDEQTRAVFLQFSELPFDRFAIHYLRGKRGKLVIRRWNSEFDNVKFSLGIYNLDRVCINESIVDLSTTQAKQLDKSIATEQSVENFHGIILDGYSYSLTLYDGSVEQRLEWKVESQLQQVTLELLSNLKQMPGI